MFQTSLHRKGSGLALAAAGASLLISRPFHAQPVGPGFGAICLGHASAALTACTVCCVAAVSLVGIGLGLLGAPAGDRQAVSPRP